MLLCAKVVGGSILRFHGISKTTKVSIVSFGIVCRFRRDDLFFPAGKLYLQLVGDSFGDLTLDRKNVSQYAFAFSSLKFSKGSTAIDLLSISAASEMDFSFSSAG